MPKANPIKSYWRAVNSLSKRLDLPAKTIRSDFKGKSDELKRISKLDRPKTGYTAFKKKTRIEKLTKELSTTKENAKIYYETIEKIGKERIERVIYPKGRPPKRLVRRHGKEAVEQFSREITRGKDKGKMVIYIDTSFKLPLSEQAALLLKAENRTMRIVRDLLETRWNDYRAFWKYFEPEDIGEIRTRTPRAVLFKEAERAAMNIEDALSDQEIFDLYIEVFGHSP